jgi:hypothetical protein
MNSLLALANAPKPPKLLIPSTNGGISRAATALDSRNQSKRSRNLNPLESKTFPTSSHFLPFGILPKNNLFQASQELNAVLPINSPEI